MTKLDRVEIDALHEALDDEYRAFATYQGVLEDFGPIGPFVNIREAEARHIAALSRLFARYGLPLPPNPWLRKVTRFASVDAACRAAVEAEIENAGLYDRLLALARQPDIRTVFRRLQEASQLRHLPAFQRCLARGEAGSGHRHRRRARIHNRTK